MVTYMVGLAKCNDAVNKELCSSPTQASLHEEINASLNNLHDVHIEEFNEYDITTINRIQMSEQEEYDATKSDENEDFVVDCQLKSDEDDDELRFVRQAIRNYSKKISFDVNNYHFVDEFEANNQVERVGQGRFASKFYSPLQIEYEVGNCSLDECVESDDSDWSYASTDGSDDDHAVRRKSRFPAYDPKLEKVAFCLGMTFRGIIEFKEVVTRYSIHEQRAVKFVRNTNVQIRVHCARKNCP